MSNIEKDRELVERAIDRDPQAFRELCDKYKRAIYNVAFSSLSQQADVQDVIQETLITFHQRLADIDTKKPIEGFLVAILKIKILEHKRKYLVHMENIETVNENKISVKKFNSSPEETLVLGERGELLEKAIQKLSPEMQITLIKHVKEGQSFSEISSSLGVGVATIKTRIYRAKEQLKELLKDLL
jgi:RNA polymerase sigma-70 factor (ECF subfamily)